MMPDDWFNRFFGLRGSGNYFDDMLRGFDDMRREMERSFEESFRDIQTKAPKDLIREYKTPEGSKVSGFYKPMISSEKEPLSDVSVTDKEVKVVVEMPGVPKEKIKVNAYQDKVEIISQDPQRRFHETVDLPPEADIETARSSYNNGILELVFKKKEEKGSRGKEIRIE